MTVFTAGRLRRASGAALGAVLLAGVLPGNGLAAVASAQTPSEAQLALKKAKSTGLAVELVSRRTEYTTTYANPDGMTFRFDKSAVPVRAKNPAGAWTAVDPTLVVGSDGRLTPRAGVVGVSFSNGGAGADMLKARPGAGRTLSLGWNGTLPKPALAGDTATYAEVLPGVDLRLTASVDGFRYGLVIKSAQAAAHPAVKRVRFPLAVQNLKVAGSPASGWSAKDTWGRELLASAPALMWDSRGSGTPPNGSPLEGPSAGDAFRPAPVEVTSDALTLVPDAGLLAQTDPAAYPLHVSPSVVRKDTERLFLRSDGYRDHGWANGPDRRGKGTGRAGAHVERLYYQFGASGLENKEVLDARFRLTRAGAAQCAARPLQLLRTGGAVHRTTTWATKPPAVDRMGDRLLGASSGTACGSGSSSETVTFTDNPAEKDENLTPTVRDLADGVLPRLTLELRAENETDATAWKSFRNDAVLSVTYLDKPDRPTGVGVVTRAPAPVCSTDEKAPTPTGDDTPLLKAVVQAKAGEEYGARLRAALRVERKQADGTWTLVGSEIQSPSAGYAGDDLPTSEAFPVKLAGRTVYRYSAATLSYTTDTLVSRGHAVGCYFTVDPTPPAAPTVTFNGPYSECTGTSCAGAGGPGTPGSFSFAPGTGSGDTNTAYAYRLSGDSTWTEVVGAKPTVTITPSTSGTHQLGVRAKDAVGRWGATTEVLFVVG
ncbi:hypothetical protein [Streptomyces sp. NPDC012888]|uniref:hypothetical protein n=1 Tax=Streptomyces sp. NPDC012888 TaxID=3364855 RepID=UPI00367A65D7